MNIDEILKLVDAGYTAQEIKELDTQTETKTEPQTETKTEPQTETKTDPDISEYTKALEAKINELVATVGKLQADNIDGAQGGNAEPTPTIEEMVANFTKDM